MKRRHRMLITTAAVGGSLLAALGLASLSRGAEGPISSGLSWMEASVGGLERRVRVRMGRPGRADELTWLAPYRHDAAQIRKPEHVLLGAYDGGLPQTLEGLEQLEQGLGTTLPLVQIYTAWGDKPDQQFPLALTSAIRDFGSIPVITWEPWLTDFDGERRSHLPRREVRENGGLAGIANGFYDFYIDEWAADAAKYGDPLIIRFAHEMNDGYRYPWGPQNNRREDYIAAWRRVVERFRAAGANNVVWVWSPHIAYEHWERYYPGDAYVDWVATGVLNYGPIAQWSQWWTFEEIFGAKYPAMAAFGKPIMIAEFGTLAVGGNRSEWYRHALRGMPDRYPQVKALLFFHLGGDQSVTYQKIDWTVTDDSAVVGTIRRALATWEQQTPRSSP